jgi:xanthine dehydrogenase YagS FAD-binding subunit
MMDFEYTRPADVAAALRAGSDARARYVAGGTTLIDLMKLGVEQPAQVVDINALGDHDAALSSVTDLPGGGLRLGALARMSDVAWEPRVQQRYPVVSQALLLAASGQLRNMASMAGNTMQRTRCAYFRDVATACNKRQPGSGCAALDGVNRTHAILGTSRHCIATHPSDLAVALTALEATVRVRRPAGARRALDAPASVERTIPYADFHLLPGDHPEREHALAPGELISAIDLPALPWAAHSLYLKVRDRASYAFALASAAVALDLDGGRIRQARVALGGVGTKPWRSHEAEQALAGKPATEATFRGAADAALTGAAPQRENAFKIPLAKRTLVRALTELAS